MSDGGKGHAPRPILISKEQYSDNWKAVFGEKAILKGYCKKCGKKESWCQCKSKVKESMEKADILPNPYIAK